MALVLVVEDNPTTSKLVQFALTAAGFLVVTAATGRAALETLGEIKPDVIIQDLMLPDIDAFDLLRRMRSVPTVHEVPIIAFSAFTEMLDQARNSEATFDECVSKPIEPSKLIAIVRRHLTPLGSKVCSLH